MQRSRTQSARSPSKSLPVLNRRAVLASASKPSDTFLKQCKTGLPQLVDPQGRHYTYLRVSIIDRCDLACIYCMPSGGESDRGARRELLTFEEIVRISQVFSKMGVRRIRLTGGEPLVRKDVVRLVEMIKGTDITHIAMTSNGTQLSRLAAPLAQAGLCSINVSLDTLHPTRFSHLTRGGDVRRVLSGIDAALEAGLEVKINAIPLRTEMGRNEADLRELVHYCWQKGITPRFIELMPLGEAARLDPTMRLGPDDVKDALAGMLSNTSVDAEAHRGPARYIASTCGRHKVGFISAVSNEFCGSCNRVRVSSHGEIRACLASRSAVSLRDVIRGGGDDIALAWNIHTSLFAKMSGHTFTSDEALEHQHVGMSLIGG